MTKRYLVKKFIRKINSHYGNEPIFFDEIKTVSEYLKEKCNPTLSDTYLILDIHERRLFKLSKDSTKEKIELFRKDPIFNSEFATAKELTYVCINSGLNYVDYPRSTKEEITCLREFLGLNQRELGEMLGYAHSYVRNMENGKSNVSDVFCEALHNYLSENSNLLMNRLDLIKRILATYKIDVSFSTRK